MYINSEKFKEKEKKKEKKTEEENHLDKPITEQIKGDQSLNKNVLQNCNQCAYKCKKISPLVEHINTKHGYESGLIRNKSENLNQFIARLGLEKYDSQYQDYFKAVMSEYHKMDTNKYPNILGCHNMYRTNI